MLYYVDASALAAVLLREPRRDLILELLQEAEEPITSGVSVWETAAALGREVKDGNPYDRVHRFLGEVGIGIVPIGVLETRAAFEAFGLYGKGSGHPARLNMGDCFSYGCATVHVRRILYIGGDFSFTPLGQR